MLLNPKVYSVVLEKKLQRDSKEILLDVSPTINSVLTRFGDSGFLL